MEMSSYASVDLVTMAEESWDKQLHECTGNKKRSAINKAVWFTL